MLNNNFFYFQLAFAFVPKENSYDCMFLSCHVRVSEWMHTL